MDDGIAVLGNGCGPGLGDRPARPAMIPGMLVVLLLVLGMMTGTVRHRHSRAGRTEVPYGSFCEPDLTLTWLIFGKWNL
jgi:hypothetical protein